ncbi:MAG: histidinol dehydrogenase [Halobacteriales archaeon]|nr:histidinol dehydrogenase [Halobacteriales archaeon]
MIRKHVRDLTPDERARLLGQGLLLDEGPREAARRIIARVQTQGDAALRALAKELDGADVRELEVPRPAMQAAWRGLTAEQRRALTDAARNITTFHRAQVPKPLRVRIAAGVTAGRTPVPLTRAGIYAPGGRAAYPSSVLMAALPAKVAGVRERVLCSPPGKDGEVARSVLAACWLAKVERVFRVGGAQAIAAMALGTGSVPRVDKVVGPGNAYVAAAKLLLQGHVGIDTPAGPSEALIIADAKASPTLVARELLCQSEHGPDSCSIAICTSASLAEQAAKEIERLLPEEPRRDSIAKSLAARGAILVADSVPEALAFSEACAPEHLLLMVQRPERWLPKVRHAGSVFLGASSAISFGDYCTGTNHVLPTGGAARWSSGLQVEDFVRWVPWQEVSATGARRLAPTAATLARLEGLEAHARSAEARLP